MSPKEALALLKSAMRAHSMTDIAGQLDTSSMVPRALTSANAEAVKRARALRQQPQPKITDLKEARALDAIARACDDVGDALRSEEAGRIGYANGQAERAIFRMTDTGDL